MTKISTNLMLLGAIILAAMAQTLGPESRTLVLILNVAGLLLATVALYFTMARKNFSKTVCVSVLAMWIAACLAVLYRMFA